MKRIRSTSFEIPKWVTENNCYAAEDQSILETEDSDAENKRDCVGQGNLSFSPTRIKMADLYKKLFLQFLSLSVHRFEKVRNVAKKLIDYMMKRIPKLRFQAFCEITRRLHIDYVSLIEPINIEAELLGTLKIFPILIN